MKYIFISHVFGYQEHYNSVVEAINNSNVSWKNYSISEDNLVDSNLTTVIKHKIENNIKCSSNVIVISGIYASHSDWIEWEFNKAIQHNKEIIAIKPWGNVNLPAFISNSTYDKLKIIGWNTSRISNYL